MSVELSIIIPALLAGMVVLTTHVPLGREVLKRGIIFIDLAVAQIAGLGVIVAQMLGWHGHGWETQLAALGCALLGALLLGLAEEKLQDQQEALIGITFVLAATGSILGLAHDPHGGDQLKELLSGQVLWVEVHDLFPALAFSLLIVVGLNFAQARQQRLWFYLLFASAVTVSVQLVGVYLVFASLIIPVFFARLAGLENLLVPFALGILGYLCGLWVSALTDLPSGPLIVWMLAILGVLLTLSVRFWPGKQKLDSEPP